MSLESLYTFCFVGVAAFTVVTCTVVFLVRMKDILDAFTRMEQERAKILSDAQLTAEVAAANQELRHVLSWTKHYCRPGEERHHEVVKTVLENRRLIADIHSAMPHVERLSKVYEVWLEQRERAGPSKPSDPPDD